MKIHVQFYAQLRDAAGSSRAEIDIADGASVSDLLGELYAKFPPLQTYDEAILVGVGLEFVDRNYQVKPGDEIAIMPPVQGG